MAAAHCAISHALLKEKSFRDLKLLTGVYANGGCHAVSGGGGIHVSPAYWLGESVFRRTRESRSLSGSDDGADKELPHIPHFSFRREARRQEGERRGNGGWRGRPRRRRRRRRRQVMDRVNAWIESQTVMHSYQLAVKKRD